MFLVCTYSIDFNVGIINPDETHHGEGVVQAAEIVLLHMSYFAYTCKFRLKTSCLPPNFRSYQKSKINII